MKAIQRKEKGRDFLYPKKPRGKFYNYRKWFSYGLLSCLFSFPYLRMNGEQLVLLNFIERKFVLFGMLFTPQDFFLFALLMLIFIVFVVCFTVIFGRLWCGWACPQTIFMEMIFRRIEYWIEGDANQQRKLDQGPWTAEKIAKKATKHGIFLLISFAISNTFLAYIIGSDKLYQIILEPVSLHLSGFFSIILFTSLFYVVFAYVRESVCTVICPYGRLQGVLLDNQSLIVAYNENRGEPRGRIQKNIDVAPIGDCVDCGLCVQVCPTGIDIRNGIQLECINCTACIDSCDEVMLKINRPPGLIGFYTQDFVLNNKRFRLGLKAYAYAAILLVLMAIFSSLVYKREDVQTTVLRASGTIYQVRDNGFVSNLYHADLVNKTNRAIKFEFRSKNKQDEIKFVLKPKMLVKDGITPITFFLIKKQKEITTVKTVVDFEVVANGQIISTASTSFFSPQ